MEWWTDGDHCSMQERVARRLKATRPMDSGDT
jgi:hypothetical protein